jgi:hypothetical protein
MAVCYRRHDSFNNHARGLLHSPHPALAESYSLTATPSTAAFGGNITVNWTAPADHAANDWIALYKVGNDNRTYITFQRPTPGATNGSLTFTAPNTADPTTAGQYEFRYLLNDEFTDVAKSNAVTLGEGYALTASSPSTVAPGGTITVNWTAPEGHPGSDWIALYREEDPNQTFQSYQYVPEGTSGSLTFTVLTTATAGQYEFRYLPHDGYIDGYIDVARSGITVAEQRETTRISIPGKQQWTNTGLDLAAGSSVTITASGTIKIARADPGKTPAGDPNCIGPAGRKLDPTAENWLTPGLSCWSLVGRIGDGAPFQIGTSVSFSVETGGRLYLGVNDEIGFFRDNTGSWSADITVNAAPQEEPSPAFNPQVTALRFFESGNDGLPRDQRVYAERFASETSRYINWELNLEYPAPGRRVDFQITAIYYFSNSAGSWEEFFRQTFDTYVEGDWTSSWHGWSYGYDDPGNWTIGSYRVDTLFAGQVIASEQFEIY